MEGAPDTNSLAAALGAIADPLTRRLSFVALLSRACVEQGFLPPVIVGGQAVEFYTAGGYATVDIDLVAASEPLEAILPGWGFRREGRHWIHGQLTLAVEAPGSRLHGDRERVSLVQLPTGIARVIGIEDLVIDRLAACVHWHSDADCAWARILARTHAGRLDVPYLREAADTYELRERMEQLLQEVGL
jgi:hypothetical protein